MGTRKGVIGHCKTVCLVHQQTNSCVGGIGERGSIIGKYGSGIVVREGICLAGDIGNHIVVNVGDQRNAGIVPCGNALICIGGGGVGNFTGSIEVQDRKGLFIRAGVDNICHIHVIQPVIAGGFSCIRADYHTAVPDVLYHGIQHGGSVVSGNPIAAGDAHPVVVIARQAAILVAVNGKALDGHAIRTDDDAKMCITAQRAAVMTIGNSRTNDAGARTRANQVHGLVNQDV